MGAFGGPDTSMGRTDSQANYAPNLVAQPSQPRAYLRNQSSNQFSTGQKTNEINVKGNGSIRTLIRLANSRAEATSNE